MWPRTVLYIFGALVIATLSLAKSHPEVLAFVTEVKGQVTIRRVNGGTETATMGGQLLNGDAVAVTSGKAVLIYLSGRSVTVEARSIHKVTMGDAKQSDLIGRVVNTLAEIAGPQTDSDRPVVHGMARDLSGVSGALPVNSRLFNPNFKFSWDPLEDVGEYEFKLEDAHGNVLGERTVNKTEIAASEFVLELGKRYVWSVQEAGSFLPRRSGKGWVEIAEKKESEQLALTLAEIEKKSAKTNKELLKAVSLYEGSYYYETERMMIALQAKGELSDLEDKMLKLAYFKMERWDRLPLAEGAEEAGGGEAGIAEKE